MDGYVQIGTKLDTKDFDAEIKYIESQLKEIEHKLQQADMGFDVGDTQKLEAQYSRLTKQLDKLQRKQIDLNKTDLSNIQKNMDKIGDSVSKTITRVGKWALAIFGIRSAYNLLRQSASTLSQYNDQISADLQYMGFALASMLQPLIEGMIQLAYKLLTYINYIAKAWFGVDLFANASADAMSKGAKSAEKMKKSLAGFDEMNVLNDNGTTGAMGATTPSMDLSAPEDVPIPSWLEWIAENKDLVIAGLTGIAGGLISVYLGLAPLMGLGIGITLAGIVMLISSIIDYLNDPSWENFGNIITSIGVILVGFSAIIGSIPLAVAGAIALIIGLIVSNWEIIKQKLENVSSWIENNIEEIRKNFGIVGVAIATIFQNTIKIVTTLFDGLFKGVKKILDGILKIIKGDFKGGIKQVFDGLKSILLAPFNALIEGVNVLIRGLNKIEFDVPDWVPGIGGKKLGFDIPEIPKLAVGGVVNMPGRGINYGGANIGERGAEGVIPLTNSQMMAQLGEAIGKYINISATVPVYVGNRQVAREIKKISADNDFAFNK